jgi:hypothetical protein
MSNVLAVATVTEALRGFLAGNLLPEIPFAVDVSARKPFTEPPAEPSITVFCYQVTPDPSQRNRDAPTRASDGTLLTRPRAALDLHYLISCYGDETQLVPQRLLGSVVRSMYVEPVLSRADIEAAAARPFLAGSDLAAAPDRVRFTPTHLDIDDLYKLWTMMSQTPFALSVTFQASVVFIDARDGAPPGIPVLRRTVRALPGGRPVVERLLSLPPNAPPGQPPVEGPVPRGNTLVVEGSGLSGARVWARVGDADIAVAPGQVRDDRVAVLPPDDLPAGVYPLRILQDVVADPATTLVKVLQSNVVPFVRQPRVTAVQASAGPVLAVTLDVPVGTEQRIQVLLDEIDPPAGRPAHAYQVDAPFPLPPQAGGHTVRMTLPALAPARYLLRVQVDGAQSALEQGADGRFSGPVADLTGIG